MLHYHLKLIETIIRELVPDLASYSLNYPPSVLEGSLMDRESGLSTIYCSTIGTVLSKRGIGTSREFVFHTWVTALLISTYPSFFAPA